MAAKGEKVKRQPITAPEVEYRKIDSLNYSGIKLFCENPIKFYQKHILKQDLEEDDDGFSLVVGTLVDDIVLEYHGDFDQFEQEFDQKYSLFQGVTTTAQGFALADELTRITKMCMEDGKPTREFEDRFREAFQEMQGRDKYKGKTVADALNDFKKPNKSGTTPESYFEAKLEAIGKILVTIGAKELALKLASNALTDPFTADLFSFKESNPNIEKLSKFPIEFIYKDLGRNVEGIKGKLELDRLEINHLEKTLQPDDLKTTYDSSIFSSKYLKNRYYLQAVWYTIGLSAWATKNGMEDYEIKPFRFIVFDTSSPNKRPVIMQLSINLLGEAFDGFYKNDRYYKGLRELVEDIDWANKNGIWNCPRKAYENNGIILLEEEFV